MNLRMKETNIGQEASDIKPIDNSGVSIDDDKIKATKNVEM